MLGVIRKSKIKRLHASIKKALGYNATVSDVKLLQDWKKRTTELCKPCWELQYCPYGQLVEEFPLLPILRSNVEEHNDYLRSCLQSNQLGDGRPMNWRLQDMFRRELADYRAKDYPAAIPSVLIEAACRFFGHVCPVFFVAEPFTETKKRRTHMRTIPRDVMLKVVRRDGQICQRCNKPVADWEVEFDHIIPFSRGGRSTVDNLRLVHRQCNRRKRASLKDLLHPAPIEHLWTLRRKLK